MGGDVEEFDGCEDICFCREFQFGNALEGGGEAGEATIFIGLGVSDQEHGFGDRHHSFHDDDVDI